MKFNFFYLLKEDLDKVREYLQKLEVDEARIETVGGRGLSLTVEDDDPCFKIITKTGSHYCVDGAYNYPVLCYGAGETILAEQHFSGHSTICRFDNFESACHEYEEQSAAMRRLGP